MIASNVLVALILVSLWVAAWLHWIFDGEIRQFLFAKIFPESWRAGRRSWEVLVMDSSEVEEFIAAESSAPEFVRGVLVCPGCLSAYISAPATLLAAVGLMSCGGGNLLSGAIQALLIPVIWAAGAWVGHRLHHHL